MVRARRIVQRTAYGALFIVVVPAGLILWAKAASGIVPLHAVRAVGAGVALAVFGVVLIAEGARALIGHGGGLPMNAFPPPRVVRAGVYAWIRNPMYIGFGLTCAGVSLAAGSAAGLWLVTPIACLAAAALVYGFERHDLVRRFGATALDAPLLSFPTGDAGYPTPVQRSAVFVWVLLPWLAAWLAVQSLGRAPDAFSTALPLETRWPVWQWTEAVYVSAYVFVPLTVLMARTQRALRRFAIQGVIATCVVTLVWLVVPVAAANRPFVPAPALGRLLAAEQAHSAGVAAFPAFHVLWALLAAEVWQANARSTRRGAWAWIGWTWALAIVASSITTGMHTLADLAAAVALFLPLRRYDRVWAGVLRFCERFANGWREWRIGPVRVIAYGVWAAGAAGVGVLIAGMAAGRDHLAAVVLVASCALVGAALWAQMLEGSSRLLRPFGWYGGVIGGALGAGLARPVLGARVLPVLAAFAIAMPWIQLIGRLRCLQQGCCHGKPCDETDGIRYLHPRSRVSQLANLRGVPIYPTPLYSILGNVVIGILLLRLRLLGAPDTLIVGVYLLLGGLARFVEESYRGEPQTHVIAGLHSYQWLAIASLVIGAICTALPPDAGLTGFDAPHGPLLLAAAALACVTGIAMGVDFPASNRRFSRLASADRLP